MDKWLAKLKTQTQVLRWILSLGVMVVSVWLLTREVDWGQVLSALQTANYTWVLVGVLVIIETFFARVWRWQALLWRADLSFWR